MLTCDKCKNHAPVLTRQNPKGKKGIFYCDACNDRPIEEDFNSLLEVFRIVDEKGTKDD